MAGLPLTIWNILDIVWENKVILYMCDLMSGLKPQNSIAIFSGHHTEVPVYILIASKSPI